MIQTLIDLQPIVSFGYTLIRNRDNVYAVLRIILSRFEFYIQEKLLKLVNWLIGQVIKDAYKDLTIETVRRQSDLQLSDAEYDQECAGFSGNWERMSYFFKICVLKMFNNRGNIEELVCREMVRFFWDWLSDQILKYLEKREKKAKNSVREKISCNICGGYYFQ
ncbi:hypothetical protein CBL_08495 [Carabus blaptoides fortunei]